MATQQVGSLIISLEARTAQIQQDMAKTKQIVGSALGDVRKEAARTADAMEEIADVAKLGAIGAGALVAVQGLASLKDGVIEVARELNQAQIASEKLQKTLFYANGGDIKAIGKDVEWLSQTANQLGQDFGVVSTTYARFAGAVKGSGLEGHAREIFESLSLAGSAFGLSVEEAEGAMRALVQMSAKGIVSAEEFRGQLADHLPVASQAAARAMGVTTGEFNRMLESGEIIADDFLPKLARELRGMSADAAKFGGETQKATAQFNNAWEGMKREVAASGVSAFISGQLSIMADAFNDFSGSIRRARAEGAGFWGQAAAGGGAALRFLNPLNAVDYKAQSQAARAEQLKALIEDKQKNLYSFSFSESLTSKQASLAAMKSELAGIEKRLAAVGTDARAGEKNAAAAAAKQKAAEARADNYVNNGKNMTAAQRYAKELRDEEDAFKGAVAGLGKGSKQYQAALVAHEQRVADIKADYAKKTAPKRGGRAAQYGSAEDRELADLRARIQTENQLAVALVDYGEAVDKITPGQKLLNQLREQEAVAKTAVAKAHIQAKITLAEELVQKEKANIQTKAGLQQAAEERKAFFADLNRDVEEYERAQMAAAQRLRDLYETPYARVQRESAANLRDIDNNRQLSAPEQAQMRGAEVARAAQAMQQLQGGVRQDLGMVPDAERIVQAHRDMQRRIAEVTAEGTAERVAMEIAASRKLAQDTQALEMQKASLVLGMGQQVFDGMASLVESTAGRQSAAYKAMFLASRAASIAMAIVNTEEAATKALTMGPILGVPAATMVRALGYTSVGIMAAQAIQGMAHDGIDSIPREGTWLLDRGERVVDARTNADLKQYLQQRNGGGGGGITVVINESSAAQVRVTEGVGADGQPMLTLDVVERVADGVYNRNLSRDLRPGGVLNGR
ncbi:tape measure protein [Vogesella urethralis]|uniref:tape measure protein n=1 Tax=Vogesella urethralis TaxID=2592656 RepID=UPI001184A0E9|nr:tape measure protein [Vogesella urethralis]